MRARSLTRLNVIGRRCGSLASVEVFFDFCVNDSSEQRYTCGSFETLSAQG